jgi:hypothetical protein
MTNDQDGGSELQALALQSTAVARIVDEMRGVAAGEIAEARSVASLLKRSGVAWLKDTSEQEALAFARICVHVGLNPLLGEAYLIHGGLHVGIIGRRKLAARSGQWAGEDAPRLLTPEEREIHEVQPGDVARAVAVWNKEHRGPAVGFGIVRAGEVENARKAGKGRDGKYFLPLAEMPGFMAAKRAAANAYKIAFPGSDVPMAEEVRSGGRVDVVDVASGELLEGPREERSAVADPLLSEEARASVALDGETQVWPPQSLEDATIDQDTGEATWREEPPAETAQATAPLVDTLGEFADVGAFYRYCAKELRLAGPRVRELAGYKTTDAPDVILGYEGGLDMLKVACAMAAALPEGEPVQAPLG